MLDRGCQACKHGRTHGQCTQHSFPKEREPVVQTATPQSCCVSWCAAHAVRQCTVAMECYQSSVPAQQVLLLCDDCTFYCNFLLHLCIGYCSMFHWRGDSMLIVSCQLRTCMLRNPYTSMYGQGVPRRAHLPSKRTLVTKHAITVSIPQP